MVPPKVEYSLTEIGKTIEPIINLMNKWERIIGIYKIYLRNKRNGNLISNDILFFQELEIRIK